MLAWLSANFVNIVLVAVLALIVGLLIRGMVRDKKAGRSTCGGNCAGCNACSACSACGKAAGDGCRPSLPAREKS